MQPVAQVLDPVRMGDHIDLAGGGQFGLQLEEALVDLAVGPCHPLVDGVDAIEPPSVDPVDGAQQDVEGIRLDQLEGGIDGIGEEVDLQAQQHRQAGILGLQDHLDVPLQRHRAVGQQIGFGVGAAPGVFGPLPDGPQDVCRLHASVEVLGECEFGDAYCRGVLDIRLDVGERVRLRWRSRERFTASVRVEVEMGIAHVDLSGGSIAIGLTGRREPNRGDDDGSQQQSAAAHPPRDLE